jgi:uncharacterized protein (DUF305 family)
MRTHTRVGAITAAAGLFLVLAACGSDTSAHSGSMSGMNHSSASSSTTSGASASVDAKHNGADVSFTQDMIVHHNGAIEMADLATTRASSQQVSDLASRIKDAQGPEITQMTSWLRAWNEPVDGSDMDSMSGMDHSSTSADSAPSSTSMDATTSMGMMTEEQMSQLQAATGAGFDRMFLQMMTVHHQGAIAMAQSEQTNGSNSQAIALARSIQTSQSAEVTEMSRLLTTAGS